SSELGFYFDDTRYLAVWEMTFNGGTPIALSNELRYGGNTLVYSMTNKDFVDLDTRERGPRGTFLIRRNLSLQQDNLYETGAIRNFDSKPHTFQIEAWMGSRFDDVFEVRGFSRPRRGRMLAPEEQIDERGHRNITLSYEGLDGRIRRTHVHRYFDCEKIR